MATDQIFQQSEVVRKKLPDWMMADWHVFMDLIKKGEVTDIGERDFRIPAKVSKGGRVGTYSVQGGDMGRGTKMKGVVMTSTYFPFRLNFEIDHLSIKATRNSTLAIKNPFKEAIKDAVPEFMLYLDKFCHSDGTALLAQATATATVSGKTQYTCNTNFGVMRLRRDQYVTVYATGFAAADLKSANTLFVEQWDPQARTILLSGLVPSAAATDKICFEGVSGASPVGVTGLYYFNSSATTGTTYGVNRANENEIISSSVNAAGGLTHEHGMAAYHRVLKRRGKHAQDMVGLCPVSQQARIWSDAMSIQRIDLSGTQAEAVDRLPKLRGMKSFMWCGVPHMIDIHQDETRIDYVIPSDLGRARLGELDFFETPGKSGPDARFFQLWGGSGGPAAAVWFGLTVEENVYNVNPGGGVFIYGLTLPTLYS